MTSLLVSDKDDVVVASFNEAKIEDLESIRQIEKEFRDLTIQAAVGHKLLVDFSRVESITSMMIGLVVRLHSQCKKDGVRLKLCAAAPSLLESFRITGLRKVLDIYPDEAKALEAFEQPGIE
jgi:anti-anti-sigma factor